MMAFTSDSDTFRFCACGLAGIDKLRSASNNVRSFMYAFLSFSRRKDHRLPTANRVYKWAVDELCIFAVYWSIRTDASGAQSVLGISACVVRAPESLPRC